MFKARKDSTDEMMRVLGIETIIAVLMRHIWIHSPVSVLFITRHVFNIENTMYTLFVSVDHVMKNNIHICS